MDFLHSEGENPTAWIFKANQYFDYHQTPPAQCLLMASFHMNGEVLVWYQDALESALFNSWEAYTRALQTSTVAAYKAQFESLSNRFRGLSDHHILSYFLSRLKDESAFQFAC